MKHRPSLMARLMVGALAGALVPAALATAAATTASAAPGGDTVTVDSSRYATPGGHGNFRWRYSSAKSSLCGIYPTDRTYTVRCAAKVPSSGASESSKYDAVEIGPGGARRTTTGGETYGGAKRLYPNHTISVVGITCTARKHATVTCTTPTGSFQIVGGVAKRP
ncbi:hypothetical protein GCM10010528_09570 [Gordonia defluvii]|uniref:Ig-like domain-containing protein n=1 Tax=Gordonia defluvii TaxID=283718 RepID=A0ABP6L614_9ACTN|nr:hypothetical protein [Gordonia sp. UBA5067]